jgi:hypothetical protein
MESIVNTFDYLMLSSINYDEGSNLAIAFEGYSSGAEKKNGSFLFNNPFAFFVLEEAIDACAYSEENFNSGYGYLKSFSQTSDPLDSVLHVSTFIPSSSLRHFRVIFRDEVVHVISLQDPIVTWM